MKPPAVAASWHISFYSGCRFSRKAHPEAFPGDSGSHKEQTLISSPVTSLGTVNPLDFFSYLRAQWTSSPLRVYPGWPLHLGACAGGGGGRGTTGTTEPEETQKKWREVHTDFGKTDGDDPNEGHSEPERAAREALRTQRREGEREGDGGAGTPPPALSQTRERGKSRPEKKSQEVPAGEEGGSKTERGSAGFVSSDLSEDQDALLGLNNPPICNG